MTNVGSLTGAGFGSSNGCFQIWIEATLRGQRPRFGRMKTWAGSISPKSTGQTVQEKGSVILPHCLTNLSRIHQEFQVSKMEALNLISYKAILRIDFPVHKPYAQLI